LMTLQFSQLCAASEQPVINASKDTKSSQHMIFD